MTGSKFIKPSVFAPRYVSRRFPHSALNSVAYKTEGDPGEDKRTAAELLEEINSRVAASLAGMATKAELDQIRTAQSAAFADADVVQLRSFLDVEKGVMAVMARQGLQMQRLEARLNAEAAKGEDMSLRGQVTRWVEANKENLKKETVRARRSIPEMQIRVDSPMHVSTVNATGSPYIGKTEVEAGINRIIRAQPNFWDYLKKGRTSAATYVWVNQYNALGEAAFLGPGQAKPGVSFSIKAETSTPKKVADSAKAGTELLTDIEGIVSFIEDELRFKVMIKANEKVMVGDTTVDSDDPTGIQILSVLFPANTGIETTNPNIMDVLRAGVGYMRSGLLTGPITIFMNPIDVTNMDISKAVDSGVYLIPTWYSADGRKIAGATIVEDYNIEIGKVQFAFLDYYRILMYEDFNVTWGWENDDFTKNLVTAVGEMRFHQFFNSIYTGAFMYDTIANIKAAITAP